MWLFALHALGADPGGWRPVSSFVASDVVMGFDKACARTREGGVVCWGGRHLGVHADAAAWAVEGADHVTKLTYGGSALLTLHEDASVRAWRWNGSGERQTVRIDLGPVDDIQGGYAACALLADESVACWGYPAFLEDLPDAGDFTPRAPRGLDRPVSALSCDDRGCLAVTDKGLMYSGMERTALGLPRVTDRFKKVKLPGGTKGRPVLMGDLVCFSEGSCLGDAPKGWPRKKLREAGYYDQGTLCLSMDQTTCLKPYEGARVGGELPAIRSVAAEHYSGCAVDDAGAVWCWGANGDGLLGDGRPFRDALPHAAIARDVSAVMASYDQTCVKEADDWHCAGNKVSTPALQEERVERHVHRKLDEPPASVPAGDRARLSEGICVRTVDRQVECWVQHERLLGLEPRTWTRLPGLDGATQITTSQDAVCGLIPDVGVRCRGALSYDVALGGHDAAADVQGLEGATHIDAGEFHLCAAMANGEVRCVGDNDRGEVGRPHADLDYAVDPVVTRLPSPAIEVAAGNHHSCALLDDRTVWCWGDDSRGQLARGRVLRSNDRAYKVKGSGEP